MGELLIGSTSLVNFATQPLLAVWLIGMYGCGALLVRELAVRSRGAWATVFLLGAAYGIAEEALALKTVFDPSLEGAGALATYGRVTEIGWVFLTNTALYHAVISISLPILFAGVVFNDELEKRWLGPKSLIIFGGVWLLSLALAFFVVRPAPPPQPGYVIVWALFVVLVAAALRAPHEDLMPARGAPRWWLFPIGVALGVGVSTAPWISVAAGLPAIVPIAVQLSLVAVGTIILRRSRSTSGALRRAEQLAFSAGLLVFFFVFSLLRPAGGTALVGAVLIVFVLAMLRDSLRREHRSEPPTEARV
jgi:hypothetical protein